MSPPEHNDYAGAKLGMWLFLYTELILFGGLFILYAVYLSRYPQEFASASGELSLAFGAVNTAILLTSSLAVALAVSALQKGNRKLALTMLAGTILMALLFLLDKYLEWSAKIEHGIYPNGPGLKELPSGEIVFFNLYYFTTGLHGLHVVIGATVLTVVAVFVANGSVHQADYVKLENAGLYWHLIDLVWIFIFPLYYLIL